MESVLTFSLSFFSAPCPPPSVPKNGFVFGPNLQHQSSVQYWCSKGFVLRGSPVSQCNDGQWDAPTPVCEGNFSSEYNVPSFSQFMFCPQFFLPMFYFLSLKCVRKLPITFALPYSVLCYLRSKAAD